MRFNTAMKYVVAVVIGLLMLSGCGAGARDVSGTVLVGSKLTAYRAPEEGSPCSVKDGYDDMKPGAPVTIRDSKGEIIAMGELSISTATYSGGSVQLGMHKCLFPFTVKNVPAGRGFYSIEVGNRGQVEFNEEALFGTPALTLG